MGLLQWSNCSVLNSLAKIAAGDDSPLELEDENGIPSCITYRALNSTFDYFPEVAIVASAVGVNARYDELAPTLLNVYHHYPMLNFDSILNYEGITGFGEAVLAKDVAKL
jgi:hypothetical protein